MRHAALILVLTIFGTTLSVQPRAQVIIQGALESGEGDVGSPAQIMGAMRSPGNDLEGDEKRKTAIVPFNRNFSPGDILVDTEARYLYFVLAGKKAMRYPVGVGREGHDWRGHNVVSQKKEWPDWRPPKVMIEREAERGHIIPDFMKGGPGNPLGARALYIGTTEYRIHGTTQPGSIGRAVSSGCIRMLNAHVIDLYARVKVGAKVTVE